MMKVLPRYRPWETGVGCAQHGHPDCLCDVVITKPVEIRTDIPHRFFDAALDELDDWGVSSRNIYEFMCIVLGMHKLEIALAGLDDRPVSNPVWFTIPETVAMALKMHARADTPVEIAMIEVEDLEMPHDVRRLLRQAYMVMAASQRAHEKRRGTTGRTQTTHASGVIKKLSNKSSTERQELTPEQLQHMLDRKREWDRTRKAKLRAAKKAKQAA